MEIKYNKLVRDKIPEIIKADGQTPFFHVASETEYWQKLKEKLEEEVVEFSAKEDLKELADILEVIKTISEYKGLSQKELEKMRKDKLGKHGGFKEKIILEKTE